MYLELETPSVVVDFQIAEDNIRQFQKYCDRHNINFRPHIKTHKLARFARLQLEAGAVGINCQKLSEAEAMLEHCDVDDLLITFNIVGTQKIERLVRLAQSNAVTVVADSAFVVNGLAAAFENSPRPLSVMVECDTGAHRCGVQTPQQAKLLAECITRHKGLTFAGLLTYPPTEATDEVQRWLTQAKVLCERAGLKVQTVSSGGSPGMWEAHKAPVVSEYRAGTYIYNDRSLVEGGVCGWDDCALTVLATVVSRPRSNRAIIDAGSKVLTSDTLGLDGYGHVIGRPDITIDKLSEEHGRLVSREPIGLTVGERLRVVPNHACVVSNMVDEIVEVRGPTLVGAQRVTARGRVW